MKRPSELEYNDLNGAEVLDILHTRFYDLLHDLTELQERFVLTRAKLRLEIVLEISGASPPKKVYHDQLTISTVQPPPDNGIPVEVEHSLSAEINAYDDPPDLVREEHGLPVPRAVRDPKLGITETVYQPPEDKPLYMPAPMPKPTSELPANLSSPTSKQVGRRRYASFVEQDYGSLQVGERSGGEGPMVGGDKVSGPKTDVTALGLEAATSSGEGPAPPQVDFRLSSTKVQDEEKLKTIVESTIARGQKIDRELAKRNQPPTPNPKGRK